MFSKVVNGSFFQRDDVKIKLIDLFIILIMMTLAACGLIYEYVFSHYAGRVLGSIETVIYAIIGIMIVSMGIGAFLSNKLKDPFFSLSILESLIAMLAFLGIFIISLSNAFAYQLPKLIAETYGISEHLSLQGGILKTVKFVVESSTYVMAGLIGVLIGMEIPLVARIREIIHQKHLQNNTGMIYGADYIGAGLGALLWVAILIKMDISYTIAYVATTNVITGFLFIVIFKNYIKHIKTVLFVQVMTVFVIYFGCISMDKWQDTLEDSLYTDTKIFSMNTTFQRIAITEGINPDTNEPFYNFFINGKTQFSELDEEVYHSMLVSPAMNISTNNDNVLVIGGGDGLAARDILKYNPKSITLIDLDEKIIELFKNPLWIDGKQVNQDLIKLNEGSFSDPRMNFKFGDAYLIVRDLFLEGKKFDNIIVDLPDPSHPDLNKMYTKEFYKVLNHLLNDSGSISIQSTSPYHAKNAFISIKKTLAASGFDNVEQYHQNVPTFGEWGWTIAKKDGSSPFKLLKEKESLKIKSSWINKDIIIGSFAFGNEYYNDYDKIKINKLGSGSTYLYYKYAWDYNGTHIAIN